MFKKLFSTQGLVNRTEYLWTGLTLMVVKVALDMLLTFAATGRSVNVLALFNPVWTERSRLLYGSTFSLAGSDPQGLYWLTAQVVLALPFLWVGLVMTTKRMIDAQKSPWLSLLFLLPFVNFVVMASGAFLPSKAGPNPADATAHAQEPTRALVMRTALFAVLTSTTVGLLSAVVIIYALGEYGSALFFLAPVLIGVVAGVAHNWKAPQSFNSTIVVASAAIGIIGLSFLLFALEGAICLAMAAPLAFPMAWMGAALAWLVCNRGDGQTHAPMVGVLVLALPMVSAAEHQLRELPLIAVQTVIEVDAPTSRVWPNVIAFDPLDSPAEWYFLLGIAYPQGAHIEGAGVGAVRYCNFSTGSFVEPITAWEAPSGENSPARLAFDVREQPMPMRELNPWGDIHPPHLDGAMQSKRGEFLLEPLAGNRTRLTGTTWYTLDIAPVVYWRWLSEQLLHSIHARVLSHVKHRSEHPRPTSH